MTNRDQPDRLFSAGMQFGLIMAVAWVAADSAFPRYGLPVVTAAMAVELAFGAVLAWRRTGLALTSMTMCIASANLALMSGFGFAGHRIFDWPRGWIAVTVASWIVCAIATAAERHVRPREWDAWDRYIADKSGWDILKGRHIPDLRAHPERFVP